MQVGFITAVKAEDGGPFPADGVLPDDTSAEDGCDLGGAEVSGGGELARPLGVRVGEEVVAKGGRDEVGGEDDGGVVSSGFFGGFADVGEGEVFNGDGGHGVVGVAEFGQEEVGGDGPGGEDFGVGVMLLDEVDGLLLDDDHVAVGKAVFGGEGGRRVEPEGADEGGGGECDEERPEAEAGPPCVDADEQNQRIDGEKIAREEGASEDGEGDPVGDDEDGDGAEHRRRKGCLGG